MELFYFISCKFYAYIESTSSRGYDRAYIVALNFLLITLSHFVFIYRL